MTKMPTSIFIFNQSKCADVLFKSIQNSNRDRGDIMFTKTSFLCVNAVGSEFYIADCGVLRNKQHCTIYIFPYPAHYAFTVFYRKC